jgi:heptosyltransferase-2
MEAKTDCLHFNGYKPCGPHKKEGVHCPSCTHYLPAAGNILIIKLAAAGEVIRNTPLLRKLKLQHPASRIFWITKYPELLPKKEIHKILPWNWESIELLKNIEFDLVLSLDKEAAPCALAKEVRAKTKKGFSQENGVIVPFDSDAKEKWLSGAFDDLMKANTKHYVQEIFEISGFQFEEETYLLPEFKIPKSPFHSGSIVFLNTGVGEMWKPRKYSTAHWIETGCLLRKSGYNVLIGGGPAENAENIEIATAIGEGAFYPGVQSYTDFIAWMSLADTVVSCVSFGFHVAVGLQKKIVLLNNTFNRHEFYMYGRGQVLQPELPCLMCYKNDFDSNCVQRDCMDLIQPAQILRALEALRA